MRVAVEVVGVGVAIDVSKIDEGIMLHWRLRLLIRVLIILSFSHPVFG